jgi:hypothetical protein
VCFGDCQRILDIGDCIGNLLGSSNYHNINFLVFRRGMSNLLEMLLVLLCKIIIIDSYKYYQSIIYLYWEPY